MKVFVRHAVGIRYASSRHVTSQTSVFVVVVVVVVVLVVVFLRRKVF